MSVSVVCQRAEKFIPASSHLSSAGIATMFARIYDVL